MKRSKVIIYIDGENFLHRVEDVLKRTKNITEKTEITKLDIRQLMTQVFSEFSKPEIRYYGTKVRLAGIEDEAVLKRAEVIAESQRRLKRNLVKQNIEFITAGSLRVREVHCRQCNKTTPTFKEKGVDVRMAVDIIEDADTNIQQVIISSDSDLLPAINVARFSKKSRITYVHHAEKPNYAMIKAAHESRVFTNNQIKQAYLTANKDKS